MQQFLIMRKLVCFLLLWNLILTGVILTRFDNKQTEQLNQQICMLEEIPMEELQ